jgi:hypothetical protein
MRDEQKGRTRTCRLRPRPATRFATSPTKPWVPSPPNRRLHVEHASSTRCNAPLLTACRESLAKLLEPRVRLELLEQRIHDEAVQREIVHGAVEPLERLIIVAKSGSNEGELVRASPLRSPLREEAGLNPSCLRGATRARELGGPFRVAVIEAGRVCSSTSKYPTAHRFTHLGCCDPSSVMHSVTLHPRHLRPHLPISTSAHVAKLHSTDVRQARSRRRHRHHERAQRSRRELRELPVCGLRRAPTRREHEISHRGVGAQNESADRRHACSVRAWLDSS